MKCVILASGKGVRMGSLTKKTPKPMLKVNGSPIIDYVLDSLPDEIDQIIIVVKYLGNQIKKYIGKEYHGKRVRYVTGSYKGNAYSFLATRKYLKNERFLLIYGDEMPNPFNVEKCLSKKLSVLTFGKSIKDGVMVLNTDIFNYKPSDGVNFSTMVDLFVHDHKVSMVKAKRFVGEINTPEQLERLNG
jgi:NDP-sugar pyrophosphorylase family protein